MRKGSDIQKRAFELAVKIVELVDVVFTRGRSAAQLAKQLLRSGTSVAANLEEADAAHSRADFAAKCGISLREARETHSWLRLMYSTRKINDSDNAAYLFQECDEIIAILTTIVRKTRAAQ